MGSNNKLLKDGSFLMFIIPSSIIFIVESNIIGKTEKKRWCFYCKVIF